MTEKRTKRTRYKLKKVSNRKRLTVFRSNKHLYAQIIDDTVGKTLASASTKEKNMDIAFTNSLWTKWYDLTGTLKQYIWSVKIANLSYFFFVFSQKMASIASRVLTKAFYTSKIKFYAINNPKITFLDFSEKWFFSPKMASRGLWEALRGPFSKKWHKLKKLFLKSLS